MKETLIDEENTPLEKLNVEMPSNPNIFTENKSPIDLKGNGFKKQKYGFGKMKSKKEFDSSQISPLYDLSLICIIFCFIYFFSFYSLLITYILSHETKLLIFLILVYIFGIFVQLLIIPPPMRLKTRNNFDEDINKILNSSILFKLINKKKEKSAYFPDKYTVDITGQINIPSNYKYAKIIALDIYAKNDLKEFIKKFSDLYGSAKVDYKLVYEEKDISFNDRRPYALYTNDEEYSINFLHTICNIFLLQWLYAIFQKYLQYKKCINIYISKVITDAYSETNSKFTVHNKKYEIKQNVIAALPNNDEFNRDWEEEERKKKEQKEIKEKKEQEKKERLRKKRENTYTLSIFKMGRNFEITVKRIYETVYLRLEVYTRGRNHVYKSTLGTYDPNIQERIERETRTTTYFPNGYDIRIEVIRGVGSYTISIGDEYTENFEYYG